MRHDTVVTSSGLTVLVDSATRTALLPLPGLSFIVQPTYRPTSAGFSTYVCRFAPAMNCSAGTACATLASLTAALSVVNHEIVSGDRSGGLANTLTSDPASRLPAMATTLGSESNLASATSPALSLPVCRRLCARSTFSHAFRSAALDAWHSRRRACVHTSKA